MILSDIKFQLICCFNSKDNKPSSDTNTDKIRPSSKTLNINLNHHNSACSSADHSTNSHNLLNEAEKEEGDDELDDQIRRSCASTNSSSNSDTSNSDFLMLMSNSNNQKNFSNELIEFFTDKLPTSTQSLDRSSGFIDRLIDTLYESYTQYMRPIYDYHSKAMQFINQNSNKEINDDNEEESGVSVKEVWTGIIHNITLFINDVFAYGRTLPGISHLPPKCFASLINRKFYEIYLLRICSLFINNELYYFLPNGIHYNKKWMKQIVGQDMTRSIFEFENELNGLNLSSKEMCLLFPFIVTKYVPKKVRGVYLEENEQCDDDGGESTEQIDSKSSQFRAIVEKLNSYFKYLLLYEFRKNMKRSQEFVEHVFKVNFFHLYNYLQAQSVYISMSFWPISTVFQLERLFLEQK